MRKYTIYIVIFLLFIGMFEVFDKYMVHNRIEVKMSQKFILNNDTIINIFGEIKKVEYNKEYSVFTMSGGQIKGTYIFDVIGSKKQDKVNVEWESEGNGKKYKVISLSLLHPWHEDIIIWPSKESKKKK